MLLDEMRIRRLLAGGTTGEWKLKYTAFDSRQERRYLLQFCNIMEAYSVHICESGF